MAFRNDGGNFSNNQLTRMFANQTGSMSADDLDKEDALHDRIAKEGIDMSAGMMGTVQSPRAAALQKLVQGGIVAPAESAAPSMAQAIKEAAMKSGVKVIPTAEQAAAEEAGPVAKNFFDLAREKASQQGVGASPMEQAAMQAQKQSTQQQMQQRIQDQIKQGQLDQFKKLFGGK